MYSQHVRRFSIVSLGFSLLLVVASGIFAYQVSPLREPTFQPNSANAGSLVPWLSSVTEGDWLRGAAILAFLVSTNLILVLWQGLFNTSVWFVRLTLVVCIWMLLSGGFWFIFVIYLLQQWLID